MKIRSGFVSNSSSSSFVLVVTKEAYDKVLTNEDPITRAILGAVMGAETVLGRECMTYGYCSSEYRWENVNVDEVVEKAKEIAGDDPVTTNDKSPTDLAELDDFLQDIVREGLGQYSVSASFKNVPTNQKWSHKLDW